MEKCWVEKENHEFFLIFYWSLKNVVISTMSFYVFVLLWTLKKKRSGTSGYGLDQQEHRTSATWRKINKPHFKKKTWKIFFKSFSKNFSKIVIKFLHCIHWLWAAYFIPATITITTTVAYFVNVINPNYPSIQKSCFYGHLKRVTSGLE